MSKRGRKHSFGVWVAIGLGVLAALGVATRTLRHERHERVAVPAPDTSSMEPEVAGKIAAVRQQLTEAPDSASAWGRFGMVLHAHKVNAEAAVAYQQAVALGPEARWHHYLAKVWEAEKPDEALAHAREAVRLQPSYVPARVLAAALLEQAGQMDAAIAELQQARAQNPSAVGVLFALGRLLLAKGDTAASLEPLERAVAQEPNLGSAHGLLARAYRLQGDEASARREAALVKPSNIGVPLDDPWMDEVDAEAVSLLGYLNRARRAEKAGDPETAEALYRHVVEIRPSDGDVHFILGELYLRYRRAEEAKASYERALAAQPSHAMAHLRIGQIDEAMGNAASALQHYREAVSSSPELGILHAALAAALEKSGDRQGAAHERELAARLGAPATTRLER